MAMDSKQSQQLRAGIDTILRRKIVIILSLFLGIAVGLVLNLTIPRQYRATALLSYQQEKVNPSRMSPDMELKIQQMVSTIAQIVTSRSDLEQIIREVGLYQKSRKKLPIEDVVDMMRKNVEIEPSKHGDIFHVGFVGEVPGQVVKVANSLAAKFIDENLKFREERASETSTYVKNELKMAKAVLDKKDAAMRDFKLKYYNEMPEQRQMNLTQLNALQQQYQAKQDSIQDLERTRVLIQEQITARKDVLTTTQDTMLAEKSKVASRINAEPGETETQRLVRLQRLYNNLLVKYTPKHPEVVLLRRVIEKLKQNLEQEKGNGNQKIAKRDAPDLMDLDPVLFQLSLQKKKLEINIKNLTKGQEQINKLIGQYEKWIGEEPVRQAQWASLTREYGELKKHYDYLVSRDLQAQSALYLEQSQRGSQFKIEDPARLPDKPFKPNFLKVMGLSVVGGLALGIGLVFGEAFLDSSFRDITDLETYLNLPVVCSIPFVYTKKERRREKFQMVAWGLAVLFCACALALAFYYFWRQGRLVL